MKVRRGTLTPPANQANSCLDPFHSLIWTRLSPFNRMGTIQSQVTKPPEPMDTNPINATIIVDKIMERIKPAQATWF